MKQQVAVLLAAVALSACGGAPTQETALPDREFAWCLTKPGAVGAIAADNGSEVPSAAQAVADEGIYDDAGRWAFYEAWDEAVYARYCAIAYVQFGGAGDDVDLAILEPEARVPSPSPLATSAQSTCVSALPDTFHRWKMLASSLSRRFGPGTRRP